VIRILVAAPQEDVKENTSLTHTTKTKPPTPTQKTQKHAHAYTNTYEQALVCLANK